MYPTEGLSPEEDEPSGYMDAAEMNRLRGVAIVQAAEAEAVLAEILRILDPSAGRALTAGPSWPQSESNSTRRPWIAGPRPLGVIDAAIKRRNRIVHDTVQVGYSWREFATGGGTHVPVISLLGNEDRDEVDLQNDLDLQHLATQHAIEVLHDLKHRKAASAEARYCAVCIQEQKDDHRTSGG